jgi:outer membrane protein assembly factor BamB
MTDLSRFRDDLMLKIMFVACYVCCPLAALAADFPQFRGANGAGMAEATSIPMNWSTNENVAWKVEVPGAGWSQPVLIGERLYLTTAVSDKNLKPKDFSDGVKMPQSMGLGGLNKAPNTVIQWQVHCYNATTGERLWAETVAEGKPKFPIHPSNTYATESPVADADGIYAFFGATGTVAALNHQGQIRWRQELGAFATSSGFGTGSSLAIYNGKVFVQHFTNGSGILICFDTKTGDQVWRVDREKKESSWSSPIVWKNNLRVELLSSGNDLICSYDPDSGRELWRLSNVKSPTACSIAADSRQIYFGGSDPFSTGPLFAMQAGASGDVSPKKKNETFEKCSWYEAKGGPGMPSPVSSGTYVYVVDKNILKCYDAATGDRLYQNRLSWSSMVAASPIVIGDKLLVISESGDAALIKVGREFEVVGGGKLDDVFWSTPAIGEGAIYFRGVDALYCVRK